MAENIYSKGTRVWFEDKEVAWISAEVTSVIKGSDDAVKLVFVDERGKVCGEASIACASLQRDIYPSF
jgi:myosin V